MYSPPSTKRYRLLETQYRCIRERRHPSTARRSRSDRGDTVKMSASLLIGSNVYIHQILLSICKPSIHNTISRMHKTMRQLSTSSSLRSWSIDDHRIIIHRPSILNTRRTRPNWPPPRGGITITARPTMPGTVLRCRSHATVAEVDATSLTIVLGLNLLSSWHKCHFGLLLF